MSKLLTFVGLAASVYVGLLVVVYLTQSHLIYFPTRDIAATPANADLSYEDVWLTTEDNLRIHAWYVPAANAKWTVLMFHGNGGNISHRLYTLDILHKLGVNTLIVDYRGYGQSEGTPTEQGTYNDAMAAWHHLQTKNAQHIIVFGRSLGGAVAMWLAKEVNPAGLILESTFTSVVDMGSYHYPWLPIRYLSKFKYNSLALAEHIRCPILAIHSREDSIVPFALGRRLFEALPGDKKFIEIQGDHNDRVGGAHYVNTLRQFFDSL